MTTLIDQRIQIPAPAHSVWAILADQSLLPAWRADCERVQILTPRQFGVGTQRECVPLKGKPYVEQIIAWYEGLGYEYTRLDKTYSEWVGRIRLQAIPEGTLVQWTLNYQPRGIINRLLDMIGGKAQHSEHCSDSLIALRGLIQERGQNLQGEPRRRQTLQPVAEIVRSSTQPMPTPTEDAADTKPRKPEGLDAAIKASQNEQKQAAETLVRTPPTPPESAPKIPPSASGPRPAASASPKTPAPSGTGPVEIPAVKVETPAAPPQEAAPDEGRKATQPKPPAAIQAARQQEQAQQQAPEAAAQHNEPQQQQASRPLRQGTGPWVSLAAEAAQQEPSSANSDADANTNTDKKSLKESLKEGSDKESSDKEGLDKEGLDKESLPPGMPESLKATPPQGTPKVDLSRLRFAEEADAAEAPPPAPPPNLTEDGPRTELMRPGLPPPTDARDTGNVSIWEAFGVRAPSQFDREALDEIVKHETGEYPAIDADTEASETDTPAEDKKTAAKVEANPPKKQKASPAAPKDDKADALLSQLGAIEPALNEDDTRTFSPLYDHRARLRVQATPLQDGLRYKQARQRVRVRDKPPTTDQEQS